nr:ThiF family adenylyltransferase [Kiritimatiellia bacterium]
MNLHTEATDSVSNPRYSGLERLYGVEPARGLNQAHVCIIGVGGVGGWVAEALARSGIGTLTLVDMDEICTSNQNRQVHALDDTVGQPKIEAMAERIRRIDPGIVVHREFRFFTESSCDSLL